MAYNEKLAERIRKVVLRRKGITEKKMFGGIAFLLLGKMFCGVLKDDLVARINPEDSETLLKKDGVRPMNFTGKSMKGFLFVSSNQYKTDKKLKGWIDRCMDFVVTLLDKK